MSSWDDRLTALSEEQQKREWSAMREDRDNFQAEAERLKLVNNECERYAGKLETALEHIQVVCRLAVHASSESAEVFDVITVLSKVKDDRRAI